MLLWAVAGETLSVYSVVRELHIALQVQAHLLVSGSLITWAQCTAYALVSRATSRRTPSVVTNLIE
jgi:hypothetical protein